MNCPRCGIATVAQKYENTVDIDRCEQCGGTWVGKGELERIQEQKIVDRSTELRQPEDTVADALEMARQRDLPGIACPVCGDPAERKEYGLASQIIVDACVHGHGLWLDKGELEALEVWFERRRAEGNEEASMFGMLYALWQVWKR
jgi:uncharacterized protein